MTRSGLKDAISAAGTLALVVCLYGTPIFLAVLIGLVRSPFAGVPGTLDVEGEREAVFWSPPPPPGPGAEATDGTADAEDAVPVEADADDAVDSDDGDDEALAMLADANTDPRAKRPRRTRKKRVVKSGAPRELTKQEQRQKDRRDRKRERRAERKQCAELKHLILQVDEDEWWFGREIANCYRTHLEQFDMLGGAWFETDDRGKSVGIGVRISRSRGEPARLAGFRSGDVIQSVNGIKVRGWGGITLAATQVMRGHAKVKRVRDGKVEVVHLRVVGEKELEEKRLALQAVASDE
ncbi:MAG: hypothetical protein H6737_05565 [Alphaproteobacteria bacterium]|nr:hypothetical protein [Alphaproteobacteria bacterium]